MAVAYRPNGRKGNDPVVLLKLLLLQHLYGLSDVRVCAEALDRISFRRFLDLGPGDTVPDDTTLTRFRERIRTRMRGGLEGLLETVMKQLQAKGLGVKPGHMAIIDATIVPAAVAPPRRRDEGDGKPPTSGANPQTPEPGSSPAAPAESRAVDPDASFTVKRGKPYHGYKVHAVIDRESGLITAHQVTPAHVHDSQAFAPLVEKALQDYPDAPPADVLADSAYDSYEHRALLGERKLGDGIAWANRGRHLRLSPTQAAINALLAPLRARIEPVFAALKRWRRLGRAVCRGLARFTQQATMSILAHNLLTTAKRYPN
jgi:IS5 family transposase